MPLKVFLKFHMPMFRKLHLVTKMPAFSIGAASSSRSYSADSNTRLVWVDLELTGLDMQKDTILEVAAIVTDSDLNILSLGPDLVVHHSAEVLSQMGEWCLENHEKSGLIKQCISSNITKEDADNELVNFVQKYIPPGKGCLAGNSVYVDRWFLQKDFPNFHNYLHYRIIDVSSIKELCKRWNYEKYKALPPKKLSHRAMDDIKDSIEELRFYKQHFFRIDS